MKKLKIWHYAFLLFLVAGTVWIFRKQANLRPYENQGKAFGTYYHIKYMHDRDLRQDIQATLDSVDASLSFFNRESTLSRVNRNEETLPDSLFLAVFRLSERISKETNGAFDITVGPLVNAWGFGFKSKRELRPEEVDSLRCFVGFEKVSLRDGRVQKQDERTMLDCGAVAKGFGVDRVTSLFDRLGIADYMVEIGGEVRVKGRNPEGESWRIGVTRPAEDGDGGETLQTVLRVSDTALATSGNYRNFYYRNGKKYAHTIDPRTGYPVQHAILSSSVMAKDCATADAYATAFMVMGLDEARRFLAAHPEIEAYFICAGTGGKLFTWATPGMKRCMEK